MFEKFDKNEIFVSKSNKVSSEISFKQKWHSKLEWSSSSASWKKGSKVKLDTKNRPTKINKEFLVNKLSILFMTIAVNMNTKPVITIVSTNNQNRTNYCK